MNPHLAHVYQLISLLVYAIASSSDQPLFGYPAQLNMQVIPALGAFFTFLFSIGKPSSTKRILFLFGLSSLTLLSLNHVLEHPSVGTLICAMYILTAVPRPRFPPTYKRLFLATEVTLLVPFIISTIFYAAYLRHEGTDNSLLFFAAALSSGSVAYIACAKLKINPRIAILISSCIPLVALICILWSQANFYLYITFFNYLGCATLMASALVFGRSIWIREIAHRAFARPELVIITYFVALAVIGSVLLQIPGAQAEAQPHSLLDTFFMAMSAACVNGLTVLDTSLDFSLLGQGIFLALIQLGGLGIVSLSAWMIFIFQRRKLSIHHEQAIEDLSGYRISLLPNTVIRRILIYFASFEIIGTVLLFWAFWDKETSALSALWQALFTAVSAFCNAGFALHSESLIPVQNNFVALTTISILTIAGSFAPLLAINIVTTRFKRLNLHAKLSVAATLALLAAGFFAFLSLEWSYSLGDLPFGSRILNAWFQSATTRSAGFNTVDLTEMRPVTSFVLMILMFIGGNPGSAAGGIKTVTAAVVFVAGLSALRGEKEARIFNRSIPTAVTLRAIAVIGLGISAGMFAFLALSVTQAIGPIPLLFETVSALGTSGLSLGVTSSLDNVGKIIVVICMLAGRVGPLTFVTLIMRRSRGGKWAVPEEDVYIS